MIVAIATQKGGSAKTTTAVNLGAALAERGERTLVVDLDGQGHATLWLLGAAARQDGAFVQDWLERRASLEQAVRKTRVPSLDLVPANLGLNRLRDRLGDATRGADARLLRDRLGQLARHYAWVLLDCPAGLNALTVNALVAADGLIAPLAPPDALALDGLQHVMVTLERLTRVNPRLRLLGLLVANTHPARAVERRNVEDLRARGLPMFAAQIPASARIASAIAVQQPLLATAPTSPPARAYRALAVELAALRAEASGPPAVARPGR